MKNQARRKFGKPKIMQQVRERLTPIERGMTLTALANLRTGTRSGPSQREESDRPDREADLIAEALRRRNERLERLKRAFSSIVQRN